MDIVIKHAENLIDKNRNLKNFFLYYLTVKQRFWKQLDMIILLCNLHTTRKQMIKIVECMLAQCI